MQVRWAEPQPEARAEGASVCDEGLLFTGPECCTRGLHALPQTGITSWRLLLEDFEDCYVGICGLSFKQWSDSPLCEKGAWVIDCETALCYRETQITKRLLTCGAFKSGSILELIFDADARTLALRIEGSFGYALPVTIFDNLPAGDLYPLVSGNAVRSLAPTKKRKRKQESDRQAKHARKVWDSRKFTDVDIVCSDRRIPCHRAILAAASAVFASMFDCGMTEGTERVVTVIEAGDAMEALLEFVYTGKLREVEDLGAVLMLADKYDMPELVDDVLERMVEIVSPATIASSLRALKPFLDQPKPLQAFEHLLQCVKTSDEMLRSMAMAL